MQRQEKIRRLNDSVLRRYFFVVYLHKITAGYIPRMYYAGYISFRALFVDDTNPIFFPLDAADILSDFGARAKEDPISLAP